MNVREYKLIKIIREIRISEFDIINNKNNNEDIYKI